MRSLGDMGGKKVTLFKLITTPFFAFFKSYIIKGGIFKGTFGYIKAQQACIYKYMILCKLYDYNIYNGNKKE